VFVRACGDHELARFCSWPTIETGAAGWLAIMRGRYASALAMAVAGEVAAYARELGRLGYYTADPTAYATQVGMLAIQYRGDVEAALSPHGWLPDVPGVDRDDAIMRAIANGEYEVEWVDLPMGRLTIQVGRDALRVRGLRVAVSARLWQRIADALGWILPTPRIVDAIAEAATIRIAPHTQAPGPWMGLRAAIVRHHDAVQADVDTATRRGEIGLIDTVGKAWVLVPGIPARRAANYGWHVGGKPIQPVGFAHDPDHVDYSQTLRPVQDNCTVDGQTARLREIYRRPDLCGLVGLEASLERARQPDTATRLTAATPTLRSGSYDDAVRRWQGIVGVPADGRFGAFTEVATKAWQAAHGLAADGVVGPATWAAALAPDTLQGGAEPEDIYEPDPPGWRPHTAHLQARWYQAGRSQGVPLYVCMHLAIVRPRAGAARQLMADAALNDRQASWHYAVDSAEITQSVLETNTAFAAVGGRRSIHIELATGYEVPWRDPRLWRDPYHVAMIDRARGLVHEIAERWGIPLRWLSLEDVIASEARGLVDHRDITRASAQAKARDLRVPPWYHPQRGWAIGTHDDHLLPSVRAELL
jgi:hypothetical protein